jgi:hypothetical protein
LKATHLALRLLALYTDVFEFVALPLAGFVASRVKSSRYYVFILFSLPSTGGLLGIRLTSLEHQWTLVGCTWLLYMVAVQAAMMYNLLATNFAGHTKRAVANGLWFVMWSAGSVAGVNVFDAKEAPRYFSAITALLVCTCAGFAMALGLRQIMVWENARRDRLYGPRLVTHGEADDDAIRAGFMDKTDIENKHFRYAL